MFSIVKVARDQTRPGSLLARPRGRLDERPWERGWDQRTPEALFTRGVQGHAPPGNFEN